MSARAQARRPRRARREHVSTYRIGAPNRGGPAVRVTGAGEIRWMAQFLGVHSGGGMVPGEQFHRCVQRARGHAEDYLREVAGLPSDERPRARRRVAYLARVIGELEELAARAVKDDEPVSWV
jgi:hypothetical protein